MPCGVHALAGGMARGLGQAGFGPGLTAVTIVALRDGREIAVFPGVQVECRGTGVQGGSLREPNESADASTGSGDRGSPVQRVDGMALTGTATVGARLQGERENDTAHRSKLARTARRKELRRW